MRAMIPTARVRTVLTASLLAALAAVTVQVPSAWAQTSDDFSAPELDTGLWQVIDPRGDGSVSQGSGLVTLAVPGGPAHAADQTANNTLRLLQPLPDTDFSLEARFESLAAQPDQEQGLIVLQNAGTYVRLFQRHDGRQLLVAWAAVVNHQTLARGETPIAAADTVHLRLIRNGSQWTGSFAAGDGGWTAVADFPHALRVDRGGVFVANTRPTDPADTPDRDNPPLDNAADKAIDGPPAPAFAAVIDYVFDTTAPIVPEDPAARTYAGLAALYLFGADDGNLVFDYAGSADPYHLTQLDPAAVSWLPGHGLRFDTPTLVTAPRPATSLNQTIMAAGAVSFEAWLTPATTNQSGPARIVSLSADPANRNLTLSHGQWGSLPADVINVRLRTSTQDLNGQPDLVSPAGSLTGGRQHVVYTRDNLGTARIYLDGSLAATGTADGDLGNWNPAYPLGLGGEADGTRNWLGDLHLAAVYSRALDPADVAANFAAGPDGGALPALAPAVLLRGLVPGTAFAFGDTITLAAAAGDADGTVAAVEFRIGGLVLHRDETAPYAFAWTNPAVGGHQIQAVAIDDEGLPAGSEIVPIHVDVPLSFQTALAVSDAFSDADLAAPWTLTDTSGGAGTTQVDGSLLVNLPAAAQSPWDNAPAILRAHQAETDTDVALQLLVDAAAWVGDGFTGLEVADSLGATVRFVASRNGGDWTLSWGADSFGAPAELGSLPLGPQPGPLWLQLRRTGATCLLLHSTDGLVWQTTATVAQPLDLNRTGWLAGALGGPATVAIDHFFNLAAPIAPEDGATGDFSGPVIGPVSAAPDFAQLVLTWDTDEAAYHRLRYGLTTGYELGQLESGFFSTAHTATLAGLDPGRTYHVRIDCFDYAGNLTGTGDLRFHTDAVAEPAPGPAAGDIYRETVMGFGTGNDDWRVTDSGALNPGAAAFLPNPVLEIMVPDLTGAVRAELIIDRWGGHPGSADKRVRLNGGSWLHVPDPVTIPDSSPECYVFQDNPMLVVPLDQLTSGPVALEGAVGTQTCFSFDWSQWGWYGVVLRIYYDESVPHPGGTFTSPVAGATITDSALIAVDAVSTGSIGEVLILGRYAGHDSDGDGTTSGWHRRYRRENYNNNLRFEGSIGALDTAPWELTWDATWIPDQVPGTVALQARIRDDNDVWYVTEIDGLSLVHSDAVVKAYPMSDVPRAFWVRTGEVKTASFTIPASDSLGQASLAQLTTATWNGADGGRILVNGNLVSAGFGRHFFHAVDELNVDTALLQPGANELAITSATNDHGPEMLWPGPLLTVRYGSAGPPPAPVLRGDLDASGALDRGDARILLDHLVGARPLAGARLAAADADGNGSVDLADAALMLGLPADNSDAKAEAGWPGQLMATGDRDDARLVALRLQDGALVRSLTLDITGDDLAAAVQEFIPAAGDSALTAWHLAGDRLRFIRLGLRPSDAECRLSLAPAAGPLRVAGTADGRDLAPISYAAPDLPTRFALVGNTPNPFNPLTKVAFELPRAADVRVRIYDVGGRLVATLVDGPLPAGHHEISWNGRDDAGRRVASGTMFARMEAAGRTWTHKMMLLK